MMYWNSIFCMSVVSLIFITGNCYRLVNLETLSTVVQTSPSLSVSFESSLHERQEELTSQNDEDPPKVIFPFRPGKRRFDSAVVSSDAAPPGFKFPPGVRHGKRGRFQSRVSSNDAVPTGFEFPPGVRQGKRGRFQSRVSSNDAVRRSGQLQRSPLGPPGFEFPPGVRHGKRGRIH